MRAVVQRVSEARVVVADQVVGEIGSGLCVLLGIARGDEAGDAERLAGRIARLRIFENDDGKFDRSLVDTGGAALVVSQFTLIADTAKEAGFARLRSLRLVDENLRTKSSWCAEASLAMPHRGRAGFAGAAA